MLEVCCLDKDNNIVEHLTQWDVDQYILIGDTGLIKPPAVHFCNTSSREALVVSSTIEGDKIKAKIPNILLQDGLLIIAYLYVCDPSVSDISAKTKAEIRIPVRPRPKPSSYPYVGDVDYISPSSIEGKMTELLKNKVDIIDGKSLSSNDFTDNYKGELDALDQNLANKANITDVLTKTNTETFAPTASYQPATKKYVDDQISTISIPVVDSLESTSTTSALSANQGKLLNDSKVDKVEGKGLSTNDFTTKYKTQLDNLNENISETVANKVDKDSVLTKTNTDEYSPTSSYHPATKKYVDDLVSSAAGSGGGDMLRGIYDTDKSGVVDDSEKLGGRTPNYYIGVDDYVILDAGSATEVI